MVALVTLDAKIGDIKGMINICIPHLVLEPVLPRLSTRYWFASVEKEASPQIKKSIENKIENTKIPITAILGKTSITVRDFIELQKGDVIQLDTTVNSELEIMVGNIHKFNAKPGVKKKKVALKITEVIRKGEEEI
jgi:flagellar motor switch protein FliM